MANHFFVMKHQGWKQTTTKHKASAIHATNSTEEDVITQRENKAENNLMRPQLSELFCADPYSFYERNSIRQQKKKDRASLETGFEKKKFNRGRKHDFKRSKESSLPPLKEKTQNRKQLTGFGSKGRAKKHLALLNHNMDATTDFRKRLALSLSFAGIYDLNEMNVERKGVKIKKRQKLSKEILKSNNDEETGCEKTLASDKVEDLRLGVTKGEENEEMPKYYVIKMLTLEKKLSSFQDKLTLPKMQPKKSISTQSAKSGLSNAMTEQRQEYRLPRIGEKCRKKRTKRKDSHGYRRKVRYHDNSFERDFTERKIPFLPVLVSGRSKL